jgi:hypothetical protein
MPLDFAKIGHTVLAPSFRLPALPSRHFVQIYERDSSLVGSVAMFLSNGMAAGGTGIVIATPDHRAAIGRGLVDTGINVAAARERGTYFSLDAGDTLSAFMVDGSPDESGFIDSMGDIMSAAAEAGTPIRIFGEMVAVLWAQGNVAAALGLEELWNSLAKINSFQLFCAYPAAAFDDRDLPHLERICSQHMQVIPPEMQARN